MVEHGNVIYIARPLFREYALSARQVHKQVIGNCLARLLPAPRVGENNLPSTAVVTVRQQAESLVLHLLHYVHQRRGRSLDIIEDVLPLHDVEITCAPRVAAGGAVGAAKPTARVVLADGYARLRVPLVDGYQIVLLKNAAEEECL